MKVKKIAIASTIFAAVAAATIGCLSAFGINLFSCSKNIDPGEAPESLNASAVPPTDGSLPTAHTGIENISYMVYVLGNQSSWHSYAYTVSDAAGGINHQLTYTFKDYKDGVLICSDMTSSSFVKSSTQTAYIGDDAYTRSGSDPTSTDINDITWDEGEPEYLQREAYYEKYGLFADEISVFILNEDTVSSCGEVTVNDDGTYTQAFTLDPSGSTYYYQFNMKTRGGLSTYPEFKTVNISFTFNDKWEVLGITTEEVADVKMGVISTQNTSVSTITFSYDEADFDETNYAFYESYFKQYVGNVAEGSVEKESELTITDALQYGFAEVLSGGKQYQIDLIAGENVYTGYVYASVDLETLSSDTLSALDIRLSLGETLDEQMLYIELVDGEIGVYYSDSFAMKANISELSLVIESFSSWIDSIGSSSQSGAVTTSAMLTDDGESSSDDDVLTQLLSLFEITETDDGAIISIDTDDLLGTGIGISLSLEFEKSEEAVLTFTGASVGSINYGGTEINIEVSLANTEAEVITHNEELTPVDLSDFAASVYDLLSADYLDISITLNGAASSYSAIKDLNVDISAQLNLEGLLAGADLSVSYGNISAKIAVYYEYLGSGYGNVYLNLYEVCGKETSLKLYCDIEDLVSAIETLLAEAMGEEELEEAEEEASQNIAQIINAVLSLDFSQVITQLYASGTQIRLGVNLDEIMSLLGADSLPALGTAALVLDGDELALSLAALGLDMSVVKSENVITVPEDKDDYLDITTVVEDIYSMLGANSLNLTLTLDGASSGIEALKDISATITADFDATALTLATDIQFSYGTISAKLKAYYVYESETYGTVYINLYEVCGKETGLLIKADIDDLLELIEQISGYIATTANEEGAEEETADILTLLLGLSYNKILTTLESNANGLTVGLDVDELLSELNVNFSGVGVLELEYTAGKFEVTADNLGIAATLIASDSEVQLPEDLDEYLDLAALAGDVFALLEANSLNLTLTLDGAGSGIEALEDISATIVANFDATALTLATDIQFSYGTISAKLKAYYVYESETYGTVYINLYEVCGKETGLLVKADIDDLLELIEQISGYIATAANEEGAEEETADILTLLLGLSYNKILTTLKSDTDGLTVGLDVDELLSELNVNFSGVGVLELEYATGKFEVTADDLGIAATLIASDSEVQLPEDLDEYLDLAALAGDVFALLEANSLNLTLTLDGAGSGIEALKDISATIVADFDATALTLATDIQFSYGTISAKLKVYYVYESETYGTVYINLYEVCGKETGLLIKADIDDLLELIEQISGYIATAANEEGAEEETADILTMLLGLSYNKILTTLKSDTDGLTVGLDVDELLSELNVNFSGVGVLGLEYTAGKFEVTADNLGIAATLIASESEVKLPEDLGEYLDLAALAGDVFALLEANSLNLTLTLDGASSGIEALEDISATIVADFDATALTLATDIQFSYGTITAKLKAYYVYESETYGTVYINLYEVCGKETGLLVKADIDDLLELIEQISGYIATAANEEGAEEETADILTLLLGLSYNKILTTLESNANGLTVGLDVDELLSELNVNFSGVGVLGLEYTAGKFEVTADDLGIAATLIASESEVQLPEDLGEYLDLAALAGDVFALLEANSLNLTLTLDGAGSGIEALKDISATIVADFDATALTLATDIQFSYSTITAKLKVYYVYESETYGTVYINLYEVCGKETGLLIKADIDDLLELIEQISGYIATAANEEGAEEETADILTVLLGLSYNKILTTLESNANGLTVGLDVDELLSELNVNFSGVGVLELEYTAGKFEVTADDLGIAATLIASESEVKLPEDLDEYLDALNLVSEIQTLIGGTITATFTLKDSGISYLNGVAISGTVSYGTVTNEQGGEALEVTLAVSYESISITLTGYYVNGVVYINVTEICGAEASVKVSADLNDLVEVISELLDTIDSNVTFPTGTDGIISSLLTMDYGEVLTVVSANGTDGINIGIDVDKLLSGLGVSLGIELGKVGFTYNNSELNLTAETIGLTLKVSGNETGITLPDFDEYLDALNLVSEIQTLIGGTITATFTLKDSGISYLNGVAISGTVSYGTVTNEQGGEALEVTLIVSYESISITLTGYYVNGVVYINVTEICGADASVKVSADLNNLVKVISELLDTIESNVTFPTGTDGIISSLLTMDYGAVLTVVSADGTDGINIGIDVDKLLSELGVSLGIELGKVGFTYNNSKLNLTAETIGLTLKVSGGETGITLPDFDGYLDAINLVNNIVSLIKSDTITIGIEIGGENGDLLNGIIESEYLDGLTVTGTISLTPSAENFALLADLSISYTYNEDNEDNEDDKEISLDLQAYYDGENVYLLVDEINGTATSIGVECTLSTIKTAISSLTNTDESSGSSITISDLLTVLLSLDYGAVLTVVSANGTDGINIGIDIDNLLSQLAELDVFYISSYITPGTNAMFGSIELVYNETYDEDNDESGYSLELAANSLGISATISGGAAITKPAANYLSVDTLVDLVNSAISEVKTIKTKKSVYFDIDCYLVYDGITLGVEGAGEVDWSSGTTVALDLLLSIKDGSSSSDTISLKLLYSATDGLTLVIDGYGITMTADDISGLQSGFSDLLTAITALTGSSGSSTEKSTTVSALAGVEVTEVLKKILTNDRFSELVTLVLGVLSSEDIAEALNNMTLEVTDATTIFSYLADNGFKVTFTANGGLSLVLESGITNESTIYVSAGTGLYGKLIKATTTTETTTNGEGDAVTTTTTTYTDADGNVITMLTVDDADKLTEVIYNYAIGVITNASIGNTLGSDTYTVDITLNGNYTGVSALKGVVVNASLYYTDKTNDNATAGESKLAEIDLDMEISGVTVKVNIIYYGEALYITLTEINGTELSDLKLTISMGDVYAIADEIVDVLLNTNLISYFSSSSDEDGNGDNTDTKITAQQISETLVKFLLLDFDSLIKATKTTATDGTITREVWVDIDGIYSAFADGATLGLGTVTAQLITSDASGKTTRTISVVGLYGYTDESGNYVAHTYTDAEGNVCICGNWLEITAAKASARSYSSFSASDYWDLAFLQHLISDAVDFATDGNDDVYTVYTFNGSLTASIDLSVVSATIEIKDISLTVGFDSSNNFYMTLIGDVDTSKAKALGISIAQVTDDWLMGFNISYSKEYGGFLVTIANNLGTDDAEYQVMTLDYLTDNLLKTTSCIPFMLGTDSTVWSLICSGLSAADISLDSGVSTADELYLQGTKYDLNSVSSSDKSNFDISTIITGISALIDGESYSSGYATKPETYSSSALSSLIGTSDYYAIDFNSTSIADLTSNAITDLYAAILREDGVGISGLVASGSIGGYVDFSLDLTYNEDIVEEYDLTSVNGTPVYDAAKPDISEFYTAATEVTEGSSYYVKTTATAEDGTTIVTYVLTEFNSDWNENDTPYIFSNDTYYIKNNDGSYTLATEYLSTETYYTKNYSTDTTGFDAPNLYKVVCDKYGQSIDFTRADSSGKFGCLAYSDGMWVYNDIVALDKYTLTVIYPDDSEQKFTLKDTSTIYALESDNTLTNGNMYVYYIVTYDDEKNEILTKMGSSCTITGDLTLRAKLVEYQVTINGVVYTFDADTDGYAVTGVTTDSSFTYSGSTLKLKDEINGYAVTCIDEKAFSGVFVSSGAFATVTTVVVPESITNVGGKAFANCTGLTSVMFLADTICMDTTGDYGTGLGEPQGFAFWGCNSTLTVYYTNVTTAASTYKYIAITYTGTEYCFEYDTSSFAASKNVNAVSSGWEYVDAEATVTINGVVYTFDYSEKAYHITGTVSNDYEGSTLILENVIYNSEGTISYKVTEIVYKAFSGAFASGGNLSGVTTVVVPENIVTIQGKAFNGCTNLTAVVFLADTIYMYCDDYGTGCGEPQGFAFWGCSSSLIVYYTNVTATDHSYSVYNYSGSEWCWSYSSNYYGLYCTSNCFTAINSDWQYINGTITCEENDALTAINSYLSANNINIYGIDTSGYDITALQTALQNAVDAYLLETYGYVGYYRVTVNLEKQASGRYYDLSISVAYGYGYYYLFEITSDGGTVTINTDDDNLYTYNGGTYVKAGANFTLTVVANSGSAFTELSDISGITTLTANDGTSYAMPSNSVRVTANYQIYFETLYVYSAVDFTYEGTSYTVGTSATEISGTYTASSTLSSPTADGYTFLGWAIASGDSLVFTSNTVVTNTYYAIWGYSSQTVSSYTVTTSGSTPNELSSSSATFYAWYTDSAFANKLTAISTDSTVLYARWQFTLTLSFTGSNTVVTATTADGITIGTASQTEKSWGSYVNGTFYIYATILEGDASQHYIYFSDDFTKAYIYNGEQIITITGYKYSDSGTLRYFNDGSSHSVKVGSTTLKEAKTYNTEEIGHYTFAVTGAMTISFTV